MSFIEVENLVKRYGQNEVVSNLSFTIEKGELFGLLGPNGAGKSTTISMISSLLKPTSGTIKIDGMDIVDNPKQAKKYIGLVPQDIALYPTLTAEDNLKFWGKMYNIRGEKLKERVDKVLDIANLKDKRKCRIETFSGGMKRRINIAVALMHEPQIIIMDEPTVGIDPQSRNHILESVKMLNKEGVTVIYTSHYMEEVEYLCNRVAIVDMGKIIAVDDKEVLKKMIADTERIEIKVSGLTDESRNMLEGYVKEICKNSKITDNIIVIKTEKASMILVKVMEKINELHINVMQTKIDTPNLESVFLSLTGRELRD